MTSTELKTFAENLATDRGIDLRHDELPSGALPKYERSDGAAAAGLGDVEAIGNYVHVGLMRGTPDPLAIVKFVIDEPNHAHFRLPFRALGDEVLEWGLAAMS